MINIYTKKEIEIIRKGGKILAGTMEELKKKVKPGITTKYLNKVAEDLIFSYKGKPSFKGFNNYPASLCTSLNEEIVHALPSKRKLKGGDILSLDLGLRHQGYCTDMAITFSVGKINKRAEKLIKTTKKALQKGIEQCRPGNHLGDIGWAIQGFVEKRKFNVIRELVGHGVGKEVHEDPQILNYGQKGKGIKLKTGMVLALEPMVSLGDWQIRKTNDGWGYRTKDNSLSAHFEKTVAITEKGPLVLTKT